MSIILADINYIHNTTLLNGIIHRIAHQENYDSTVLFKILTCTPLEVQQTSNQYSVSYQYVLTSLKLQTYQ
jgi:hypothetical protein